jgi:membrane protease YdiL (CAAX protease family)
MREKELWPRLLVGLVVVFALFQWVASALGSERGEAGLSVGLLVVGTTLLLERLFFRQPLAASARALGLGPPVRRGLLAAVALSLVLLFVIPVFAWATQASVTFYPGWSGLLLGLFTQAGLAEETLFRGYLFGHLRRQRSFWRASGLATIPFVVVHLLLFVTLPWPLALASILLAVVISFPLAYLFDLGGGTIWAPALVHFVVQGAIKIVVVSPEQAATLPLVWIAASAVVPFVVFLLPQRTAEEGERRGDRA